MSNNRTPVPEQQQLEWVPLANVVLHPLNANVVPPEIMAKLTEHVRGSGRYPPLIARRLADGRVQVLDGAHRLRVIADLGESGAWCLIWDVNDEEALILLATLNRLHGEDLPAKRSALIAELEHHQTLAELARLLPETEAELRSALQLIDVDVDGLVARLTEEAERVAAEGPQLFSFALDPADAPIVEEAIVRAGETLTGMNRRGHALASICRQFLRDNDVGELTNA